MQFPLNVRQRCEVGQIRKLCVCACVCPCPRPQDVRLGPKSHYADMIEFALCVTSLSSLLDKVL